MTILSVMPWISGCAPVTIDTSCDWTDYILVERQDVDVVSDSLARQIVSHNEKRSVVCE